VVALGLQALGLGRVAVLAAAGLSVDDFDHVLLPPLPASTVVQPLLAAAGIDPERVVTLDADTRFDTVELVAPTLPGIRRQYSPILSQWLRKVLDTAAVPPNRKLFVVRRGFGRNPVEETEFEQIAAAGGFEIYDPMTSNDQLGDFQQAGAIIGVSGSALATVAERSTGRPARRAARRSRPIRRCRRRRSAASRSAPCASGPR